MRRPLTILSIVAGTVAVGSVTAALALAQTSDPVTGDQQTALDQRAALPLTAASEAEMDRAVAAGPYSVTCKTGAKTLTCSPIKDEDVVPALKRGEDVYGRTVTVFDGGGAKVVEDSATTFESTDLLCSDGIGASLTCSSVTDVAPTVRAGARVLVYYRKHNVTFDAEGHLISHIGTPTVPLQVLPEG